jgi:hypothetical protein
MPRPRDMQEVENTRLKSEWKIDDVCRTRARGLEVVTLPQEA